MSSSTDSHAPNAHDEPLPPHYQEWEPPPALADVVARLWTHGAFEEPSDRGRTIVPDNSVDLIWCLEPDGDLRDAYVVGPMSRPLVLSPTEAGAFVGVRLKPGHAASALRLPVHELRDERVGIESLLPRARTALVGARHLTRRDVERAVTGALAPSLQRAPSVPSSLRHALDLAHRSDGRVPVESIAREVGVSRQHLARLFEVHVGLRPKFVSRVLRLQNVMALARRTAGVAASRTAGRAAVLSWSALAAEAGYADQSHMVADFVSLAGASPTEWLAGL